MPPPNPQNYLDPAHYGEGLPNFYSLFDIAVVTPPSFGVSAGHYAGWCMDSSADVADGPYPSAELFSTCDAAALNVYLQPLQDIGHTNIVTTQAVWNEINWLLNARRNPANFPCLASIPGLTTPPQHPTMWEVQIAIYDLLGQTRPNDVVAGYPSFDPNVVKCLKNAAANHTDWRPACGDKVAVVLVEAPDWQSPRTFLGDFQILLIEVPWCPPVTLIPATLKACYTSEADAIAAAITATTSGNSCCGLQPLGAVRNGPDCDAVITVNATNSCGNTASVDYHVRIDGTAPSLTVPANVQVQCDQVPGLAKDSDATATDNCDQNPVVKFIGEVKVPGTALCTYYLDRTWEATDSCGNKSSQTQRITVVDTTAPVITKSPAGGDLGCNPLSIPTDETIKALVSAMDNCATPIITVTHIDGGTTCAPSRTFSIVASDGCGNSSQPTQVVFTWKADTTAPVLVSTPKGGDLGCNPTADSLPTDASIKALVTASDDCGTPTVTVTHTDGGTACAPSRTFTITATDGCNNASQPTQVVFTWKADTTAPVLVSTPKGGDLGCNPTADSLPTDASIKALVTASDDCGTPTVTVTHTDGGTACAPSRTFTITATDGCNNASQPTQVVFTWKADTTAPVLVSTPKGGDLGCNPTADSLPTDASIKALVTASDDCGTPTVTVTHTDGGTACAPSRTFTITATDGCNNASQPKQVTYTWKSDTAAPVFGTINDLTFGCGATPVVTIPSASDNCGTPVVTGVRSDGKNISDAYPAGVTTITWTATDGCNNSIQKTQKVTVTATGYCVPGTFTFNGSSTCKPSTTFTVNGVTVTVSAFSQIGGAWSPAQVGQYGSYGLGVTSIGEDGSSPNHTLDNNGNKEYLLFEFSAPVIVTQAGVGWVYSDSDMVVYFGNLASHPADLSSAVATFASEVNLGGSSIRTASFNSGNIAGNALIIAAKPDESDDYFKINSLGFCQPSCTPPPPPPTGNCVSITALKCTPITPVTMTASGGCGGPYTFSASGLPSGLTMDSTGKISGSPLVTGTFNYTVTITDKCGKSGTVNCSVTVGTPPPPPDNCVASSTFDFTGGYSAVTGTAGNSKTFTAGGVTVRARAFSRNKITGAWAPAYLGWYSHGLGVTDASENGLNNSHTVDNVGDYNNFVLFEFSQTVTVESLYLGYVVSDSDLTLKIGTFTDPYNNPLSSSQFTGFTYSEDNLASDGYPRTAVVNSGKLTGNAILVAALVSDTTPEDQFKISTLNICSSSSTVPPPWKDCDFGSCYKQGSCNYKPYIHTVCGSGDDIWNNSDSCHYEWQPASGDCAIIVRCTGVGNTDPWAKAGCMIRETLNSDSKHASCFATPGNGCAFQWRGTTGGSSGNSNQPGTSTPCWLKLVRTGNVFSGYRSNDGVNWTKCGEQTIYMGSSCYIGLAVTSHNNSSVCTATFDNITVNP